MNTSTPIIVYNNKTFEYTTENKTIYTSKVYEKYLRRDN